MVEVIAKEERRPTLGEEIANSISHGIGLVLAMVATPILIMAALRYGNTWRIVGVSVFAASMVTLYLSSTLYHALTHDRAKQVFRMFDHCAIFLLIAGTYTPFTLGILRGPWGWTLLGLIWTLAAIGLTMKMVLRARYSWLSVILYLVMGWLVVIAAPQILRVMPLSGLAWLAAGGIAYTAGVGFYAAHRVRYAHFAWHLFVIAGTVCHFFAVLWYSA
ncbi:MAG: hemolysin [Blastocatellia bacterium]|jgi:hemolysin III|nr:hemolysin [Blastocatellia bacterium]